MAKPCADRDLIDLAVAVGVKGHVSDIGLRILANHMQSPFVRALILEPKYLAALTPRNEIEICILTHIRGRRRTELFAARARDLAERNRTPILLEGSGT